MSEYAKELKDMFRNLRKEHVLWFTTINSDREFELFKSALLLFLWLILMGKFDVKQKLIVGSYGDKWRKLQFTLLDWFFEGKFNQSELLENIMNLLGVDRERALDIAITELANLSNIMRKTYYERAGTIGEDILSLLGISLLFGREDKYVWVTQHDEKVCKYCQALEQISSEGLTLRELEDLISHICPKRVGSLCHINCRCAIIPKRIMEKRKSDSSMVIYNILKHIAD